MSRLLVSSVGALVMGVFGFTFTACADDLKAMEGTWRVQSVEAGGKPVDSEDFQKLELKITDGRYAVTTKDGMDSGTLKLDETQNPRTMDATKTEGFDAGKVVKAIYLLEGDTLRVCCAPDGGERPTELATKDGAPWVLIVYRRAEGR